MWKPIKEFQIGFVGWLGGSNNDFSSFKPSLRQANKHKNPEAKRFTYMACQFKGNNVHSAYLCVLLTLLLTSMGQCLWAKEGVLLDSLTCFCNRTVRAEAFKKISIIIWLCLVPPALCQCALWKTSIKLFADVSVCSSLQSLSGGTRRVCVSVVGLWYGPYKMSASASQCFHQLNPCGRCFCWVQSTREQEIDLVGRDSGGL